jgi:2-dehydro-3-deoxyphosphooctonate aldolase (KDO 8-P synthase)
VNITPEICAGKNHPLFLIAGPCVIESQELILETAGEIAEICQRLEIPFIFKSSFDKANRSSIESFRGPGLELGLQQLQKVKDQFGLPLLTDIHTPEQAAIAAEVVDVLQIPAFLCRQTDLLVAAAKTGKTVNVKKGQFLAPQDMTNIVTKLESSGCNNILLTERGSSFGYQHIVVDFKAIPMMQDSGYPVVFDATHSVQIVGGQGKTSGGDSRYVPTLAKAAVAAGADGVFLEVHPDPKKAKSDGPNMIALNELEPLLRQLKAISDL